MNFLAHAYLSFGNEDVLIGNMISDFVKGKAKENYPASVQKGIILHRDIDVFTDQHEATKNMKKIFKPAVGLYAGVFTDIVYDFFLANDKVSFKSQNELYLFSQNTYNVLQRNYKILPEKFQQLLPFMLQQNWLYHYKTTEGIEKSFKGIFRRAEYLTYNEVAFNMFLNNLDYLKNCYSVFMPQVHAHTQKRLTELLTE